MLGVEKVESLYQDNLLNPVDHSIKTSDFMNNEMPDFGFLETFMQDQEIGDIMINGIHNIYVEKAGKLYKTGVKFNTHEELQVFTQNILAKTGQSLSKKVAMIDARLPDGSRINIITPPLAVDGISISIRKFPASQITLDSMVAGGKLPKNIAHFLSEAVAARTNLIVCGGCGSGKTTLLNALSAYINADERVVTIEDSAELQLQQEHVLRLEANAQREESIRDLVKNALRMRPDRIIIGESRGPEALDMLQAMNTGHEGSMTTLHANSPRDAISRLETMISIAMPQLTPKLVRQQIVSTVQLVINTMRCKDGVRRIMYVSEITGMEGEIVVLNDLVVFNGGEGEQAGYKFLSSPRAAVLVEAAKKAGLVKSFK